MKYGKVGLGSLLPADQDAVKTIQPGLGWFDHPTAGFDSDMPLPVRCLRGTGPPMTRDPERLCRRVLEIRRKALPPGDPATLDSLNKLAQLYLVQGRREETARLLQDAGAG